MPSGELISVEEVHPKGLDDVLLNDSGASSSGYEDSDDEDGSGRGSVSSDSSSDSDLVPYDMVLEPHCCMMVSVLSFHHIGVVGHGAVRGRETCSSFVCVFARARVCIASKCLLVVAGYLQWCSCPLRRKKRTTKEHKRRCYVFQTASVPLCARTRPADNCSTSLSRSHVPSCCWRTASRPRGFLLGDARHLYHSVFVPLNMLFHT